MSSEVVSGAQAHASTWTPRISTRESLGCQRIRCGASCDGIRGHQRASAVISASLWGLVWGLVRDVRKLYSTLAGGNQWQSVAISGNQWQSTYVSFTPLWPEGHRSARVVTSAHELLEGEAYLWGRGGRRGEHVHAPRVVQSAHERTAERLE